MKKSPSETATLVMSAADAATEIFLMDAKLHRIASGVGRLEKEVPPGLYKVRFRSGAKMHDELVDVGTPGKRVTVTAPRLEFRTPAPIDDTATTHEYQSGPAAMVSHRAHLKIGHGAGLLLFVREEDEKRAFSPRGVAVHALDGTEIAPLAAGEGDARGRWAALNLRLDPGTYSIRVLSKGLGDYEIFATTSAGWQTQVFLTLQEFWKAGKRLRAPSLRGAAMFMARQGRGFRPHDRTARLAELARHALAQGRNAVAGPLLNEMLRGKFTNPMLGIFGAHLLLGQHRPDRALLEVVIGNLGNILGQHPDLQALRLAAAGRSGTQVAAIRRPPSLRASWDHIVQASRRRASLVPSDSAAARVADELVMGGLWLIHRLETESVSERTEGATIAEAQRIVEKMADLDSDRLRSLVEQTASEGRLSGLERSVLGAAMSYVEGLELMTATESDRDKKKRSVRSRARQMLGDLSAPSYSIANAVVSLADKMKLG